MNASTACAPLPAVVGEATPRQDAVMNVETRRTMLTRQPFRTSPADTERRPNEDV